MYATLWMSRSREAVTISLCAAHIDHKVAVSSWTLTRITAQLLGTRNQKVIIVQFPVLGVLSRSVSFPVLGCHPSPHEVINLKIEAMES